MLSRPATATRRGSPRATGLACLLLIAAASSCGDAAAPPPPPPPPVELTIGGAGDTVELTALGETRDLSATTARGSSTVGAQLSWAAGSPSIVIAAQSGRLTARGPGRTFVYAVSDSGGIDSVLVVVQQRVDRVTVTPDRHSRPIGRTWRYTATAFDRGGAAITGAAFLWSSLEPAVATVNDGGVATARTVGVATIRASSEGVAGDAELRVTPTPPLRFVPDTIDVGVGQFPSGFTRPQPILVADSIDVVEERAQAALVMADPTVASVAPTITLPMYPSQLVINGLRAGTTRITATAPLYERAEAVVRVSTPRLVFYEGASGMHVPMGQPFYLGLATADSLGNTHHLLSPLDVSVTLSDASVARPAASTVTAKAGDAGARFELSPTAPGTTRIFFSAPGYRPDSVDVTVTPASVRFMQWDWSSLRVRTVGVGQQLATGAFVGVSAIANGAQITTTLSQRHPETVRLGAATVTATTSLPRTELAVYGLAAGSDTVVASAPGFLPDTLIVHVTTPTFRVDPVPTVGYVTVRGAFGMSAADSTGSFHFPASPPVLVRVTSSDPRVIQAPADLVPIGATTGGGGAAYSYVGLGTATLTFSDPTGLYTPVTSAPITVVPAKLLMFFDAAQSRELSLGMRQRAVPFTEPRIVVVPFDFVPTAIRLRSSDTSVVRPVPSVATVEMNTGATAKYDLVGGDVAGRAWIVGELDGAITDSVEVVVSRPQLAVVGGGSLHPMLETHMRIQLRDGRGNPRATNETLRVLVSSSRPDVVRVVGTEVTVPAGGWESDEFRVVGVAPGTASIRAADPRSTAPYRYDPGASTPITVTAVPITPP